MMQIGSVVNRVEQGLESREWKVVHCGIRLLDEVDIHLHQGMGPASICYCLRQTLHQHRTSRGSSSAFEDQSS